MVMSKNSYPIWAIAVFTAFGQPIVAQELKELNLPKSGLTESGLRSQEELQARLIQLTDCAECSMIIGSKTYFGSEDYISFADDGVAAVLNGYSVRFESFRVDTADLAGCERYVGGKIASGPHGLSGRYVDESLAFTFSGARASLASENVVKLKTKIVWPRNPMSADFPAKIFVESQDTVLLPFSGQNGDELVSKINELSELCETLGWP